MKRHWKRIENFDFNGIAKEIKKLVKQEQAENLIEVSWDDVGGLELAKEEIVQTILLPIRHP
jgi:SpoVK/Ycf46/Vps4 family AAA+-type ATPase